MKYLTILGAAIGLASSGCSHGTTSVSTPGGVSINIHPIGATMAPGQRLPFAARVDGSGEIGVDWSVVGGDQGGTISPQGIYTAPTVPGGYQIVATSRADSSKTAFAMITVVNGTGGEGSGGNTSGGASGGVRTPSGGTVGIGTGGVAGSGGSTQGVLLPGQALHCFADDGTPPGQDITLSIVANRTSGVAPLAVFFDTLGTKATATTKPYHELGYCWDFGDSGAGTYSTSGLPKNTAKGPVAAHVFEKPGTYTVNVNARDTKGRVATQGLQIFVQDPEAVFGGTSTVCVSTAGDFTGCPNGATHVSKSTLSSLNASVAANRRLLLHRGETFTDDGTGVDLGNGGPGVIGSYGIGARPIIKATGGQASYLFNVGTGFSDWRIMDLDVQSNGTDGIVNIAGKATTLLALRIKGTNIGTALMASTNALKSNQDIIDGPAFVDCELRGSGVNGASTMFVSARRFALLGNILRNVTAENGQHVVRTPWVERFVVSSNDFSDIQSNGGLLKLNALHNSDASGNVVPWTTATGYSERVNISDNVFNGAGGGTFLVGAGPQNANFDERVRDVIFERNLFLPGPGAALALNLDGVDLTIRDNIFNRGQSGACIDIAQYASGVPPTGITILNNICYSDGTHPPLLVSFDNQSVAAVVNNLVTSPKGGTVIGTGKQITQAGNLVTSTPGFSVSSPKLAPDFQSTSNSPAIDTGDSTWVSFWDYAGRVRPVDGNGDGSTLPDVGAYEFGAK